MLKMKALAGIATAALILTIGVMTGPTASAGSPSTVGLGTARSFAVLAGSAVTNTGPSVINGDLGVSPGTAVTGFPPGIVNGTIHSADAVAGQAQSDLTIAYNDAAGRPSSQTLATELGGRTLRAGVYDSETGTFGLTGTVTLDAEGDNTAVFIFQTDSTLITASSSRVQLINGAQACRVFWQVGSSATLGTATTFRGSILALTSITLNTGTTIVGRALARNGAVTLDTNVITRPTCETAQPTPTPTAQPTPTPTAQPTPTDRPTPGPTDQPTPGPTGQLPTPGPTDQPTPGPTGQLPTPGPTDQPTPGPTGQLPTPGPTDQPTPGPTDQPTPGPTGQLPTPGPTDQPTPGPTDQPTPGPTGQLPTPGPTDQPTPGPTDQPTPGPTDKPAPGATDKPAPGETHGPNLPPTGTLPSGPGSDGPVTLLTLLLGALAAGFLFLRPIRRPFRPSPAGGQVRGSRDTE